MVFITMISIIPTEMITVNGSSFSQPDKVPIGIDVIKEANMTSCYPGDTINFSIYVENIGGGDFNPVIINDTLPSGMTYVSSSPDASVLNNNVTWISQINSSENKTFYLIVRVDWNAQGVLQNLVNATGMFNDGLCSDEDTSDIFVNSPIQVVKSVHYNCNGPWDEEGIVIDMNVDHYDWCTFRINVTNIIDTPLNVTITDILPDGLINGDHYYPFYPDAGDDSTIIWYLDGIHHNLLQPGQTMTFGIRAEKGECGVAYMNQVFVSSTFEGPDTRVDTDTASVMWINCDDPCIDQSVFDRGFPIRHAADGNWGTAQSFISPVTTIDRFNIYIRKFGTPEFDLVVELRENDPLGTIIETNSFSPSSISSCWTWQDIGFTDTVIVPGTEYFIVIPPAPSGVTTSYGYEWGYGLGDLYADGSFWFTRDGGVVWHDLPGMYDFCFVMYGSS
jgi:uncharacterized repeat protein (TIGR01451 family)